MSSSRARRAESLPSPQWRREPQRRRVDRDCVTINVGGSIILTSKSNLSRHSSYFARRFDDERRSNNSDNDVDDQHPIFMDHDPKVFQVLLNYMRNDFIKASQITSEVLMLANFLGMNRLLDDVKFVSYNYLHFDDRNQVALNGTEETRRKFDAKYGSIRDAVMSGILPQSIRNLEFAELVVFDTGVKVDNDTRKSPYDNDDDDDDDDDEEEKKEGGEDDDDDDDEEEVLLTKSQILESNLHLYTLFSRIDVPHRYEDRSPKNPENFGPTCLDGLNRLHAYGFTTLLPERKPIRNQYYGGDVHCTRWFSRNKPTTTTTQVDNYFQRRFRSSIIFDNDGDNNEKRAGDAPPVKKQFALLQGGAVIANVGNEIQMCLDSCDADYVEKLEKSKATIAAKGSEKDLLTWLSQNGYTREGEELDNLFQSIQRSAFKLNRRGWPSSTVPVQVWSKPIMMQSSTHATLTSRVAHDTTTTTTNNFPSSPYSTMVTDAILENYSMTYASSSRPMTDTANNNCCIS